ncbi:MAG: hypothetical protein ACREPI_06680 [Candidatus Dormibacterales bacterium]
MTSAIAGGCLAFIAGLGLQYAGWRRLLRPALSSPETASTASALRRWAFFAVAVEVALLALCLGIALAMRGGRVSGFAWAAVPLGALLGSSLPLQAAASAIARRAV